jgi:hypothetical protein
MLLNAVLHKRACARSIIKVARQARITCNWSSPIQWNVLRLLTCKPVLATVATGLCPRPELATTKTPLTLLPLSLYCLYRTWMILGVLSHARQPHFTANHGQLNSQLT